jgi:hypothetical protein
VQWSGNTDFSDFVQHAPDEQGVVRGIERHRHSAVGQIVAVQRTLRHAESAKILQVGLLHQRQL